MQTGTIYDTFRKENRIADLDRLHKGIKREREMKNEIKQFFSTSDLFARHTGIELVDAGPGWAKASMKIEPIHFNGAGTVHGGAIFTLADFAFAVASNSHGTLAMGINTSISFVKAATSGTLHAEAVEQALNPRLASYSVRITDDHGAVIAVFQGMAYRKNKSVFPFETSPHDDEGAEPCSG